MDNLIINGVALTQLTIINGDKGKVMHAMKSSSYGFSGFGEAYFSTVEKNAVKGWKKHLKMTLNLVVPVGCVSFFLVDDRDYSSTNGAFFKCTINIQTYSRLTIPPGIWVAFKGNEIGLNLILNLADIEHDPLECENAALNDQRFSKISFD